MENEKTLYIRDTRNQVIYMQGILPDGTIGIVADEARPFTDEELNNPELFKEHMDNLNKRLSLGEAHQV